MSCIVLSLRNFFPPALACSFALAALGAGETNGVFKARAEAEFHRTRLLFESDARNSTNSWQFASACFDLTEFATNNTQKAALSRLGISACQQLLARESNSAPGHYYIAMNDGGLADALAPSMAAYRLVHQVESEFKVSAALDEKFDFGGAVRCLGLLYRDAPGWPLSIGSKWRARDFLERAAAIAPDYPENQLNLAETYLKWRQMDGADNALIKLDAIWNRAHTNLTGEVWDKPWYDWTNRRTAARAEFQKDFKRVP